MKLPVLYSGVLVRRYKRFLADIDTAQGESITAHCPNTGAMTGCAEPGSTVYFSLSDNPKRKYPHTLELVETSLGMVSVNTGRANSLVGEALEAQKIAALAGYSDIKAEAKIPDGGGRFDFLLRGPEKPDVFVEVKSVSLSQGNGLGAFPDAVSERALKHVNALKRMVETGHRGVLLFCAQHCGIERVTPARSIDPAYARGLEVAIDAGVEVYALGCATDLTTMQIDREIEFLL